MSFAVSRCLPRVGTGWRFGATPLLLLLAIVFTWGTPLDAREQWWWWPPAPQGWDPTTSPVWFQSDADEPTVSLPAVDDTAAYAFTLNHQLIKRALDDGREVWRVDTGERRETFGERVAVASGTVLVGEWDLMAFDSNTGRHRWTFRPSEGTGYGAYLGAIDRDLILTGSRSGHVAAVHIADGRTRWLRTVVRDSESLVRPPVVDDDDVVAAYTVTRNPWRGGVVSLNLADGREQWRFEIPEGRGWHSAPSGSPVITERRVFVPSENGEVYVLDRDTGVMQARIPGVFPDDSPQAAYLSQDMRKLARSGHILGITSLSGVMVGIDIDTLKEAWRYDGSKVGSFGYELVPGHGAFYATQFFGYLLAVDATTGDKRWITGGDRREFNRGPVVVGPDLVVAGETGTWRLHSQQPQP